MKKIIFIALACIVMCSAACSGFEPKKIKLTDKLTCYTLLDEITGDTLTGVLAQDRTALISPLPHTTFSIEQKHHAFLIATDTKNNMKHYYTLSGKLISTEALLNFDAYDDTDKLVYTGRTLQGQHIIYFPKEEKIFQSSRLIVTMTSGNEYLGFQTLEGFRFTCIKGEPTTWTIHAEKTFYFVFEKTKSTVVLIDKNNVALYNFKGEKIKTIPIIEWHKILERATEIQKIGKGTVIRIETDL